MTLDEARWVALAVPLVRPEGGVEDRALIAAACDGLRLAAREAFDADRRRRWAARVATEGGGT